MKRMVIWAVLFASLLVVTGAAFAQDCYKVTGRDLTNSANSFTANWWFDWYSDYNAEVFTYNSSTGVLGPFLFDANFVNMRAITFDSPDMGAYMTFHGNWTSFDGLFYDGDQYTIHGVAQECP